MTRIKICGMRRTDDILYVNKYRPDYAGFILSPGFKRTVDLETFRQLQERLDKCIKRVGVFVNEPPENILRYYAETLDVIQLHGDENRDYISKLSKECDCEIWKAVRTKTSADIEAACLLPVHKLVIDSYSQSQYGGTGKQVDLEIIRQAKITKPVFLAGGLNVKNIAEAISQVKPYGVDFSSSVETDGFKDEQKICEIIAAVRNSN